ncbi:MAG: carbamate kinase [Alphaproteobacteria bacterium]|nr:carbamate kinase [Alphaproteobacteria bacterium]
MSSRSPAATAAPPPVVVALGGNALIRPGEQGTPGEQAARIAEVAETLVALAGPGGLVLTHGNGPQVGRHLLRSDLVRDQVPPTSLELAVAATQGEIGWMVVQALEHVLRRQGDARTVVALMTRTRVALDDPAFQDPRKFVGRFYTEAQAMDLVADLGWRVRQDGDRGWRRVVPSPRPLEILEAPTIASLAATGALVVGCGGGGVPVVDVHGHRAGAEAVVDKDLATALLAGQLGARRMVVLTGVDTIWKGFGTPAAAPLHDTDAPQLQALLDAGEFPAGSMGPKVEAALAFLAAGGEEVLVTSPEALPDALAGRTGTRISRTGSARSPG